MGERQLLDPRALEFRPRNYPINLYPAAPVQIPVLGPPLPPPPAPEPLFYPYSPPQQQLFPYGDGGVLGYHHQYVSPLACVRTIPPLPPESAAPTRALVLSSVPCGVSESIVRRELEVFGEVRGVQMERVADGIVTVHFYDLRHAEAALKEIRGQHMQQQARLRNLFSALAQNSGDSLLAPTLLSPPLPARGLVAGSAVWAQFSIPSCTAVPEGLNQGTVVVFNLDPNLSTNYLREIFQAYGAVKELRETPMKRQQRFVEFYDIRDAAKALREMNGKEIHGKQVVIEFSRPGGFSRKFLNANKSFSPVFHCATKSYQTKFSNYSPPQPPPPPPPFQRRFSGFLASNVSPRAGLPSKDTQYSSSSSKKSSICIKGNPNESFNSKGSIEASVTGFPLNCTVKDEVVVKTADGPPKRNAKSKIQSSQSAGAITISKQAQSRSKPWKGKSKKLDTRFLINEEGLVESHCGDTRTTVMIKNIPNKYSQKLLLNMLDNHCIHCNEQIANGNHDQPLSSYDFVYLPIDFNNKCNVGYGFVNMTSPQATWRLYKAFHHQHWEVFNSRKICEVTYARVQGLEALKEHFKNSKFPSEMDHYLPVVFSPPRNGRQQTEPLPIVGHKEQPIIFGLHCKKSTNGNETDGGDDLKNDNGDTDPEEHEKEALIHCSSSCSLSRNGGDSGDDDRDSSCSSTVVA